MERAWELIAASLLLLLESLERDFPLGSFLEGTSELVELSRSGDTLFSSVMECTTNPFNCTGRFTASPAAPTEKK